MKNCCLWINGKKVKDINGIKENFNISDVRGYFYGGRLADWLSAHDAEKEAELVRMIPTGINPDKILQEIFCEKKKAVPAVIYHRQTVKPDFIKGSSSFTADSSFNTGSHKAVAGSFGSYSHQWEFAISSFLVTSFKMGSFSYGSFNLSGFNFGSFALGSFSVSALFKNGSFNYDDFANAQRIRDKALLSYFTSEPLNKYGYGIHLI